MNEWALLGVGVLLTIGTGLFVAAEFSLVNLDRHDLETRAERGEKRLRQTIAALRITSTHLSSAQLGITLTTLLTGYTFEPAISMMLKAPLTNLGVPPALVTAVSAVLAVLLATTLSMVVGELVPKNFALALPLATAKVVMPFQTAFTMVFKPLIVLLNNNANSLIRRLGIEPQEELSGARSADELIYLIRHSATAGLLDAEDATLLDRALRFSARDAADVMTPRVRMSSVPLTADATAIVAASASTGHSRLPVVEDGPDDIVGVVHVKKAFAVALPDRITTFASQLMFEPLRVPESLSAPALLAMLRESGLQIAIVTDEYGGTAGVVTLEDLVEEIVGELEDEHDHLLNSLTRHGRSVSFDASWRPDELLDRTGVHVPEDDDWETVAGYVSAQLGRLPELGDQVGLPSGLLRVTRTDGHRIVRLQFVPSPIDSADSGQPPTQGAVHP